MQPDASRKLVSRIAILCGALFFWPAFLHGQGAPKPAPANPPQTEPSPELRALTDAVRDLQNQVQILKEQLNEMRTQQQQALAEARELRRQASGGSQQNSSQSTASSGGLPYSTAAGTSAYPTKPPADSVSPAQEQTASTSNSRTEEDIQLLDAKINDQYQTKVESGSKYRLRLSGIVLLNLFSARGAVDNLDFPGVAVPANPLQSNAAFGGSLRQSQFTLAAFGPDIAGAHTSANISFDFAGGYPATENGQTFGIMRLRTGTVRFDWGDTSVIAGQDSLFLSPLAPSSLASLAAPAFAYAGNLWSWSPQVRIEHKLQLSESDALHFQFGILDSLTGDFPVASPDMNPSWGEQSGQPAYAGRISWSHRLFGRELISGFGGYYARENWGFGRHVDGWAGTTDLTLPLGKYFDLTGEFYRGRAVGGLGGGIYQTALVSGPFTNSATMVQGLDSMGGWAQLKFKPVAKFEINGAFGQDNPFASQISRFPASMSQYGPVVERNHSPLVNFIYQPRSDVLFSIEYRRLRTFYFGANPEAANYVNMSLGYIF